MAKAKARVSKTGVTSGGRIALYSNSKEVSDLDPALVRFIPGNSLSSLYLSSGSFDDDLYSYDDFVITEEVAVTEGSVTSSLESEESAPVAVPSSSDITILSQQVVYDASGIPSVTVIFRIKNSSGVELKGMNARIELL